MYVLSNSSIIGLMYSHDFNIRVKYADTDQMGYVYYGRYLEYLEVARTEAMRALGVSYNELETEYGTALPVMDVNIKYLHPARYDNLLTLKTTIKEMPGVRIVFDTEILREDGKLLNLASVRLCFVDIQTEKPMRPPEVLLDQLKPYFD